MDEIWKDDLFWHAADKSWEGWRAMWMAGGIRVRVGVNKHAAILLHTGDCALSALDGDERDARQSRQLSREAHLRDVVRRTRGH